MSILYIHLYIPFIRILLSVIVHSNPLKFNFTVTLWWCVDNGDGVLWKV